MRPFRTVLLLLTLLPALAPSVEAQNSRAIRGRVVTTTGEPLEGALVATNGGSRFTDSEGRFSISVPAGAFADVTFVADGFVNSKRRFHASGAGLDDLEITLTARATTLTLGESVNRPDLGVELGALVDRSLREQDNHVFSSDAFDTGSYSLFRDPANQANQSVWTHGTGGDLPGPTGPIFDLSKYRTRRAAGSFVSTHLNGFLPAAMIWRVGPDGTTVQSGQEQLLSSFLGVSSSVLVCPSAVAGCRDRLIFTDRDTSTFRTWDVDPTTGALDFRATWVPSLAPITAFDGGMQPTFVHARLSDGSLQQLAQGLFFEQLTPVSGTATCPQPFTDRSVAMLHGWSNESLTFSERLFDLTARYGPGCGPASFSDGGTADDLSVFGVALGDELWLTAKRMAQPGVPAQVLKFNPSSGPDLAGQPRATAVLTNSSGAITFGVGGSRVIWGWSADSEALGGSPFQWPFAEIGSLHTQSGLPLRITEDPAAQRLRAWANVRPEPGPRGKADGLADATRLQSVPLDGCVSNDRAVCLNGNRFAVSARYQTRQGDSGHGHARPLSSDSGTFWFFDKGNRELIVKVLDGCAINGHFWFFAAGLTDVGVHLQVVDRAMRDEGDPEPGHVFVNPLGTPFQPILRTDAFRCSDEKLRRAERSHSTSEAPLHFTRSFGTITRIDGKPVEHDTAATANRTAASSPPRGRRDGTACGGAPEDLCLAGDRFRIEVDWTDFSGGTGSAFGRQLTDDTGALFFFDRANVEMLVKVLDACAINDRFWLFSGALTDVGVDLQVTDTQTGQTRLYTNTAGDPFRPINDTQTFPCGS